MEIVSYLVYLDINKGHHRCTDYGVAGSRYCFVPGTVDTIQGLVVVDISQLDSKW